MEIRKTFLATRGEIEDRKFNIYIGISVGNKWFTKDNLRKYLHWALNHTKDKVLFLICDKIQTINYDVRNKNDSKEKNLQKAMKKGDEFKKISLELISELPKEKRNKVRILRWGDYEKEDIYYKKYSPIVKKEFKENLNFRRKILEIVKESINDRKFSEEEYVKLSNYLLEEFITIYSGIKIGKDYYGIYIYPHELLVQEFRDKIQKGEIFSELNKKLPKEKVALAIVN